MEGLAIDFTKSGAQLSLNRKVGGFGCAVQNGLVNIGTLRGTDAVYPAKGTALYINATLGAVTSYDDAYHESNIAALDTLVFLRNHDYSSVNYERIKTVALEPVTYEGSQLVLTAQFTGEEGTIIGVTVNN